MIKGRYNFFNIVNCSALKKIMSKCNKLVQKEYWTRHDRVWKVIHSELCKKSVIKNETHKLLWGFQIQTDHLISARRPDQVIINKKKKKKKKEKEKREKKEKRETAE